MCVGVESLSSACGLFLVWSPNCLCMFNQNCHFFIFKLAILLLYQCWTASGSGHVHIAVRCGCYFLLSA